MTEHTIEQLAAMSQCYAKAAGVIPYVQGEGARSVQRLADRARQDGAEVRAATIEAQVEEMKANPVLHYFGSQNREGVLELQLPSDWPDGVDAEHWKPFNDVEQNLDKAHALLAQALCDIRRHQPFEVNHEDSWHERCTVCREPDGTNATWPCEFALQYTPVED